MFLKRIIEDAENDKDNTSTASAVNPSKDNNNLTV